MGEALGFELGFEDGEALGCALGLEDGEALGFELGFEDGEALGPYDGKALGCKDMVGMIDGVWLGEELGSGSANSECKTRMDRVGTKDDGILWMYCSLLQLTFHLEARHPAPHGPHCRRRL